MAAVAGYWSKPDQLKPWLKAIKKLAQKKYNNGSLTLIEFQRYPACLIVYAFGLGAIASANLVVLRDLLTLKIAHEYREEEIVVSALNPVSMFQQGTRATKLLPAKERHYLPLNSWIEDYFVTLGTSVFQSNHEYILGLDKLEFLWVLANANTIREKEGNYFWVPFGNFIYRSGSFEKLLIETKESITKCGENSPYVQSELFGTTVEECTSLLAKIEALGSTWTRGVW